MEPKFQSCIVFMCVLLAHGNLDERINTQVTTFCTCTGELVARKIAHVVLIAGMLQCVFRRIVWAGR